MSVSSPFNKVNASALLIMSLVHLLFTKRFRYQTNCKEKYTKKFNHNNAGQKKNKETEKKTKKKKKKQKKPTENGLGVFICEAI